MRPKDQNSDKASANTLASERADSSISLKDDEIEVLVEEERWHECTSSFDFVNEAAKLALSAGKEPALSSPVNLSILFSTDKHIRELNKTYRGFDKPTNVLAFPAEGNAAGTLKDEKTHLGDIILAFETVLKEANEQNKTPASHITHLVIHGVLHLMGYDHTTSSEAMKMEQLEVQLMIKLGLTDPYASTFN